MAVTTGGLLLVDCPQQPAPVLVQPRLPLLKFGSAVAFHDAFACHACKMSLPQERSAHVAGMFCTRGTVCVRVRDGAMGGKACVMRSRMRAWNQKARAPGTSAARSTVEDRAEQPLVADR